MQLIRKAYVLEPADWASSAGHFILRVVVAVMVLYVHGWHKLEGWIDYAHHGIPWTLRTEIAEMHSPAPFAWAIAATIIQFVCPLFIGIGLFTRINALLLTGVLSIAVLQNLLAARDPQLAILYTLIIVAMIFMGGGKFSFDARLLSRKRSLAPESSGVA